jgi:TonB family protein
MELPARVSKYELVEFLGGGMSHVYRARDTVIGRTVAVKILTEAGCQDAEAKARFLAEARMAGNISHDNIISIYDFGEDEKQHPFMVMEFLRGEDLRHAIKNGHTGDILSKLRIALQTAHALEYIHTQKIVHRDIKPENIHVNGAGVVKLMDFGIAKSEGLAMTRAGYVLGTPYYMSPEQVTGQNITEQVDVYAFGILLFELLTGHKPISGETVERIFYSILNEPLDVQPLRDADIPESVCDLVKKCTLKSPAGRPQGFAQVCADLDRAVTKLEAAAKLPTILLPATPLVVQPVDCGREPASPAPLVLSPASVNWPVIALAGAGMILLTLFVVVGLCGYFAVDWETVKNLGTVDYAVLNREPVRVPAAAGESYGDVVLSATVDEHGVASGIAVQTSSGSPFVDESAVAALKHWRFRPKRINWRAIPFPFVLTLSRSGSESNSRRASTATKGK